eukprot:TRINITY_DN13697_c0_g1_i1.p1 TRINITY_DN13697_c0_g1~~TRINITY_DN13697_c0_g1_i1.p1  ORF type:complete len:380 (-),score=84.43 TRINITY_DN13697_c0_g1_i1:42-1034(-)
MSAGAVFEMEPDSATGSATGEPDGGGNDKLLWVREEMSEFVEKKPDSAVAVMAVMILTRVIKMTDATTMMELQLELRAASAELHRCKSSIAVSSSCELFIRFVTRTWGDRLDFEQFKALLIERGEQFTHKAMSSRVRISQLADRFIKDGARILTHGYSRVVAAVLKHAVKNHKRVHVYITETRPESSGYKMAKYLTKHNIPVTLIMDAAVAHFMERVDFVLVGAAGMVESGGIINKIGTYQTAVVAKAFNKPVYVAAESFKFARLYPLTQTDVPLEEMPLGEHHPEVPVGVQVSNPKCDYTPPKYVTLLFTDLGVLSPSSVSDELIKLYA